MAKKSATAQTVTMQNQELMVAHEALLHLAQLRVPTATAMRVRRLTRVVGPTVEDVQQERRKLVRLHADLDERGEPHGDENGKIVFKSDDDREAYAAAHRELMELETTLEVQPLTASELGVKEIQAGLLIALDDLLLDDLG
ncbi:MAG: hypothetical protein KDE20_10665 [Caldilineaceae bacterium]|nr:hypothetical protein [Caldilineaceae bacterium]